MKNVINKLSYWMVCAGAGMVVTGCMVWVILLASEFKGF